MKRLGAYAGRACSGMLLLGLLQACGGDAGVDQVSQEAGGLSAAQLKESLFAAMGGLEALESARILVQEGSGVRHHLGQIPATGGNDPRAVLDPITEIMDLQNGRAAFRNTVTIDGGFGQQRTEVYTTYEGQRLGWGTTGGRANIVTSVNGLFSWATHNTPEFLTRRNPISIALSAASVPDTAVVREATLDGGTYWYLDTTLDGESIGLYLDQETALLHAFTALDSESIRGDQEATYVYGDWRPVADLQLPHEVEIRHGDGLFARLEYSAISVNDESALAIFEIPEDARAQADQVVALQGEAWAPIEWVEVAPGVAHIVAFSHNSMVVELPNIVVVAEGAYTEAQSLTLARMVQERTGKSIRYVIPSHPHYDHTGGLRGLAAVGATVLTAAGHEAEIRGMIETTQSNPLDALSRQRAAGAEVGSVEVFSGSIDITDGDQQVLLYEVTTIPHVNPKVLIYVPHAKVLFQSDIFFGGGGPDATALYEAIVELGLEVEQIVGGHGGVLPFATLETAVNGSN
ncbi:MAG TPA: MBL fold metallo-hydrolase [Pseudomonadaceae bacterium]|nr:MBL fold metallo-hydrolase [Pseudomonadaceae bacterium]